MLITPLSPLNAASQGGILHGDRSDDRDGRGDELIKRAQIRKFLGFLECTVAEAEKLTAWLSEEVCQRERRVEWVSKQLLAHCREVGIEQPLRPGSAGSSARRCARRRRR